MSSHTCLRPVIRPGAVIFLVFLCYLAPLRWAGAFLLATAVHELGHLGAIALCRGRLRALCLGPRGAVLEVADLSPGQELFCALAGPLAGLSLLTVGKYLPMTALLALGHSLYNLLPIYPLDGGRALRCALAPLGETGERLTRCVGIVLGLGLAAPGIYGTLSCRLGLLPLLFGGSFFLLALNLWRGK